MLYAGPGSPLYAPSDPSSPVEAVWALALRSIARSRFWLASVILLWIGVTTAFSAALAGSSGKAYHASSYRSDIRILENGDLDVREEYEVVFRGGPFHRFHRAIPRERCDSIGVIAASDSIRFKQRRTAADVLWILPAVSDTTLTLWLRYVVTGSYEILDRPAGTPGPTGPTAEETGFDEATLPGTGPAVVVRWTPLPKAPVPYHIDSVHVSLRLAGGSVRSAVGASVEEIDPGRRAREAGGDDPAAGERGRSDLHERGQAHQREGTQPVSRQRAQPGWRARIMPESIPVTSLEDGLEVVGARPEVFGIEIEVEVEVDDPSFWMPSLGKAPTLPRWQQRRERHARVRPVFLAAAGLMLVGGLAFIGARERHVRGRGRRVREGELLAREEERRVREREGLARDGERSVAQWARHVNGGLGAGAADASTDDPRLLPPPLVGALARGAPRFSHLVAALLDLAERGAITVLVEPASRRPRSGDVPRAASATGMLAPAARSGGSRRPGARFVVESQGPPTRWEGDGWGPPLLARLPEKHSAAAQFESLRRGEGPVHTAIIDALANHGDFAPAALAASRELARNAVLFAAGAGVLVAVLEAGSRFGIASLAPALALLLCGSYAAWRRKRLHPWTAAGTARVTVLRDWGASLRRRAVEPEPVSTVEFYQKLPYAVALGLGLAWVEAGIRWEVGPPRWMRGEGASLGIVRGWLRGPAR